jgi:hypothetical protein
MPYSYAKLGVGYQKLGDNGIGMKFSVGGIMPVAVKSEDQTAHLMDFWRKPGSGWVRLEAENIGPVMATNPPRRIK